MTPSFRRVFSAKAAKILKLALEEDIGKGDVTSRLLISPKEKGRAVIRAKDKGLLCGTPVVREIFRVIDPALKIQFPVREGGLFRSGQTVAVLRGRIHSILKGERTALNFLGLLSGTAFLTHKFVNKTAKKSVLILDTRKTIPLLREFQKYAVCTGGGKNHRFGLYDEIFVKENHRRFGDLTRLKRFSGRYEIEVRSRRELGQALKNNPGVILLDNFLPAKLRQAVRWVKAKRPEIILEASGGIRLSNVSRYAASGVDWISTGQLTHSVRSLDFSLLIVP